MYSPKNEQKKREQIQLDLFNVELNRKTENLIFEILRINSRMAEADCYHITVKSQLFPKISM